MRGPGQGEWFPYEGASKVTAIAASVSVFVAVVTLSVTLKPVLFDLEALSDEPDAATRLWIERFYPMRPVSADYAVAVLEITSPADQKRAVLLAPVGGGKVQAQAHGASSGARWVPAANLGLRLDGDTRSPLPAPVTKAAAEASWPNDAAPLKAFHDSVIVEVPPMPDGPGFTRRGRIEGDVSLPSGVSPGGAAQTVVPVSIPVEVRYYFDYDALQASPWARYNLRFNTQRGRGVVGLAWSVVTILAFIVGAYPNRGVVQIAGRILVFLSFGFLALVVGAAIWLR